MIVTSTRSNRTSGKTCRTRSSAVGPGRAGPSPLGPSVVGEDTGVDDERTASDRPLEGQHVAVAVGGKRIRPDWSAVGEEQLVNVALQDVSYETLRNELMRLPGVVSVAATSSPPAAGSLLMTAPTRACSRPSRTASRMD